MTERNLRKLDDEEWREIPLADKRYEISNYGRVKSYCYDKANGKILKPGITKGFLTVTFKTEGKKKTFLVHKLVAMAFVEKENPNESIVIHIDWNKRNNHYSNLKWVTKETAYERIMPRLQEINKIKNKGIIRNSKLKAEDVEVLKGMLQKGVKQNVIAKLFSISEMQVTRIKRGENWAKIKPTVEY
ncbi:MAG: NUMOD4 motif-containing HNH endonuclease [Bacteroidales bacterium]|nr:NUMOD4 motif-containing HNH endonuclease [Bacteroidales bacterium]